MNNLVLTRDDREIFRAMLAPGEYVIGRDPDAEIFIDIPDLSRHHARLILLHDDLKIEDLRSSNGTFVDDEPVSGQVSIVGRKSVRLGDVNLEILGKMTAGGSNSPVSGDSAFQPEELMSPNRYQVGGIVAHGGMGNILDARQNGMHREVAMKVMRGSGDAGGLLRFVNEARITGELEHPNIVPVHELGVDENGQVFYTMKFVRGITLAEVISMLARDPAQAAAKYPLTKLLTVFQKVCDAIAFAHSKGIIHRDLKPENIMLGDYGEVLVMDWGLAKRLGFPGSGDGSTSGEVNVHDGNTIVGAILGTPRYMAPEQARGEIGSLDFRTDIYSLGTILHEILYLRPVVSAGDQVAMIEKVARGERDKLPPGWTSAHLPGGRVPVSLRAVRRKSLAPDPDERYQHVAGLQADLSAYQAGFATGAEDAGLATQLALLLKRHRGVSLSIGLGTALLALVSGVYTLRVIGERNRATTAFGQSKAALKRVEETLVLVEAAKREADTERDKEKAARAEVEAERARHLAARAEADRFHGESSVMRDRVAQAIKGMPDAENLYKLLYGESLRSGRVEEALANIEKALALAPRNFDYAIARANLLQASGRFSEAVPAYRRAISIRPDAQGEQNLALTEKILAERQNATVADAEVKKKLDDFLKEQNRVESILLDEIFQPEPADSRATDQSSSAAPPASYSPEEERLFARLGPYTSQPGWNHQRITTLPGGGIHLNLNGLSISDLGMLQGTPVRELDLSGSNCATLASISGLPLTWLAINNTPVTDVSPLAGMPLRVLVCHDTPIRDLSPLRNCPLELLNCGYRASGDLSGVRGMKALVELHGSGQNVTDLEPLRGLALRTLHLWYVSVSDLAPLAGMPITNLNLTDAKAIKDFSVLGSLLQLERLTLPPQACRMDVLKKLPRLQTVSHPRFGENLPVAQFIKLSEASDLAWNNLLPVISMSDAKDLRPDRLTVRELGKVDLDLRGTRIRDLRPLARFPIHRLLLDTPPPALDLSPLANKPDLLHLSLVGAAATDIRQLLPGSKLESFAVNRASKNVNLLGKHPALKYAGYSFDEKLLRPKTTLADLFSPRSKDEEESDGNPPPGLLAAERFDSLDAGAAGWTCDGESQTDIGFWMADSPASKGRGGGCFGSYHPKVKGVTAYFKAPVAFSGGHPQAFGGCLEFQIKQSDVDYDSALPDVEIVSGDLKLVVSRERPEVLGWQTILVPLDVDAGWKVGDLKGTAATAEELQKVLSNLDSLRIRATLNDRAEGWTDLDDVTLWDKDGRAIREQLLARQNAEADKSMEWGDRATIVTSPNLGSHHLENHEKVYFRKGIGWVARIGDHKGVAVLHPIDGSHPATISYPLPESLTKGAVLEIVASGSTVKPGSLIRVTGGGKVLCNENIDDQWKTIRVPLDAGGTEMTELKIEVHARGWFLEHCYIDTVGILE